MSFQPGLCQLISIDQALDRSAHVTAVVPTPIQLACRLLHPLSLRNLGTIELSLMQGFLHLVAACSPGVVRPAHDLHALGDRPRVVAETTHPALPPSSHFLLLWASFAPIPHAWPWHDILSPDLKCSDLCQPS